MKRLVLFLMAALLLAAVVIPALGAEEVRTCTSDPDDGSRLPECGTRADNECYAGGTMAGKCDNEWLWKAGWEIARFNDGRMTREQVNPEWAFLLPPPVELPLGSGLAAGCYQQAQGGWDLKYNGPINTLNNAEEYDSSDGSCSGTPNKWDMAVLDSATEDEAESDCAALLSIPLEYVILYRLDQDYVDGPAGYWVCEAD
jgi:hypothetical protein